ncbi:hypothetical protein HU200_012532 [Digitaria exilis]|uniref:Alkaline/neutral invertase n=1 Tax=Digitaria exilis TaxID=1010633 RepID=A0A835FF86_9POAL|nr:hypothetical protein HU200_012532 [Digitaria exilis]
MVLCAEPPPKLKIPNKITEMTEDANHDSPKLERRKRMHHIERHRHAIADAAWEALKSSIVYFRGQGTVAAIDKSQGAALNYEQVFMRDFIPSALAFLMKGEHLMLQNFLVETARLQPREKKVFLRDFIPSALAFLMKGEHLMLQNFLVETACLQSREKMVGLFKLGQGVMLANCKVHHRNPTQKTESLLADFGETAIGRVAPVDSGLWWILLLPLNKFNVIPESIPDWIFDFMPGRGGYFIGNVNPVRMDLHWFCLGNIIAIMSPLATGEQAEAILDVVEECWEELIRETPVKICYPAMENKECQIITVCDLKNTKWSCHNGGSWPDEHALEMSSQEEEHIHGNFATFFVKLEGTTISVRQDLSITTTKMLLEHAYKRKGIRSYDGYALYCGKVLDDNKLLFDSKVCNDCTVEVKGRGRAGRQLLGLILGQAMIDEVPAMYNTLMYDPWSDSADPEAARHADEECEETSYYTGDTRGCLKFSRNHFRHAKLELFLERVEASFSLHLEDFLPNILRDIVSKFEGPSKFDMVTFVQEEMSSFEVSPVIIFCRYFTSDGVSYRMTFFDSGHLSWPEARRGKIKGLLQIVFVGHESFYGPSEEREFHSHVKEPNSITVK